MARISLQGRLLHADEASAARAISVGLSAEQGIAWNLFPPVHRFLIVAVIGAAFAHSRKDLQICHLKKCDELRDQVLSSMQQKLDSLCEMVNNFKEQLTNYLDITKISNTYYHYQMFEILLHDNKNLVKIDAVQSFLNISCKRTFSLVMFWIPRITELEDIIWRQNKTMSSLKKVLVVLEQTVVQLTRLRRPSFRASRSNDSQLPLMIDNILYDRESTTSPSSSDLDSSSVNKAPNFPANIVRNQNFASKFEGYKMH
uniref:Uncharacterized protein n=1 Tax=Cajanus cajan TaxID=3821 RepID=A0A151SUM4_CAJCA|nr:hypothetical protein KK1_013880 [Cajanus cajan]